MHRHIVSLCPFQSLSPSLSPPPPSSLRPSLNWRLTCLSSLSLSFTGFLSFLPFSLLSLSLYPTPFSPFPSLALFVLSSSMSLSISHSLSLAFSVSVSLFLPPFSSLCPHEVSLTYMSLGSTFHAVSFRLSFPLSLSLAHLLLRSVFHWVSCCLHSQRPTRTWIYTQYLYIYLYVEI